MLSDNGFSMNKRLFYSSLHKNGSENTKPKGDKFVLLYSKSTRRKENRNFPKNQSNNYGKLFKLNESLFLPIIKDKVNFFNKKIPDRKEVQVGNPEENTTLFPQITQGYLPPNSQKITNSNVAIKKFPNPSEIGKSLQNLQDNNSAENETHLGNNDKYKYKRPLFRRKKSSNFILSEELKRKRFSKQLQLPNLNSSMKTMNYVDPDLRSCDLIFESDNQAVLEYIKANDLLPDSKLKDIYYWLENINLKENVEANRFTYNSNTQWFEY